MTSFDLNWPRLTSVDLRRTGWPVECMSTTWYYMPTSISLAKPAMFASYVPRKAFSAWHDPSYDVIGQMLGGSGSWNLQGGRKKDVRKAIEKMVAIERLTKRYSRKTAGGRLHQPLVPTRVNPPPPGGCRIRPPRFFRNNFFIDYCIDIKLGKCKKRIIRTKARSTKWLSRIF